MNNLAKYYYIELEKFRKSNPDMKETVNQWLSLIDMERGDLLKKMKQQGMSIETIKEITNLDFEEIEKL